MENVSKCNCPLCGRIFAPEEGSTPKQHLAMGIIKTYSAIQRKHNDTELRCPRCGKLKMRENQVTNAYSRHYGIYICNDCGTDEALRDYGKYPLPLLEWDVVKFILLPLQLGKCDRFIPEKESAYPLCDNRECAESLACQRSAHLEDDGGYSRYDK